MEAEPLPATEGLAEGESDALPGSCQTSINASQT